MEILFVFIHILNILVAYELVLMDTSTYRATFLIVTTLLWIDNPLINPDGRFISVCPLNSGTVTSIIKKEQGWFF